MTKKKEEEKTKMEILNEVYEKLKEPFPEEALSVDSSRGFDLTSVKAQYIVERLNEVIGFSNWRLDGNYEENEGSVLFVGNLHLFLGDFAKAPDGNALYHQIPTVGFSGKKKLLGDAYKGARTDALSKAASYIGVANDVFKGKVAPPNKRAKKTSSNTATSRPASFQGKSATLSSEF